jgi:hypothetical protein
MCTKLAANANAHTLRIPTTAHSGLVVAVVVLKVAAQGVSKVACIVMAFHCAEQNTRRLINYSVYA